MHQVGKSQPVHTSGHLNVGEQNSYVVSRLKDPHGLVSVDRFYWHKPRILNDVHSTHPEHQLIFHNQNDGRRASFYHHRIQNGAVAAPALTAASRPTVMRLFLENSALFVQ